MTVLRQSTLEFYIQEASSMIVLIFLAPCVRDLLAGAVAEQTLVGADQYLCAACGELRDATRQVDVTRLCLSTFFFVCVERGRIKSVCIPFGRFLTASDPHHPSARRPDPHNASIRVQQNSS